MLKKCLVAFRWSILLYIFLGFVAQFFSTIGIWSLQVVVDRVVTAKHYTELVPEITLYGAILIIAAITHYILEYPHTYLSHSIFEKLKIMALSKVSKIDYAAYQNIGTGEMIKVIENGAAAGRNMIHSFYLQILHDLLPTVIFSLLFLSFYNREVMIIILAGYIIIFIMSYALLRVMYRIKTSLLEKQENMSKYSIRGFMELVVFRLNKRYVQEISRLRITADEVVKKNVQIKMIHESFFSIFALFVIVIKIVVLAYGVKSVISDESSIGVILALLLLIDQVYTPIAIFNVLFVEYKLDRVTYNRFENFLNAPEDINLEQGTEIVAFRGNVEFQHVSFAYGNFKLLHNMTFSIKQGSTVAIVGLSGSGKSTIIKLILGLLKKSSGHILLDGVNIDEVKLNSLYNHISYVSQEAPIFDTTIRENIVFDEQMTDEQIYEILDDVHLKETVWNFPDRLNTMVGERGMKLSGGERQRLAFARIIAQQRSFVILDEPFSALDHYTEQNVMNSLTSLLSDKTIVIITHQLHFLEHVDHILLVKNGVMVGEGSFKQLLHSNIYFQQLWDNDVTDKRKPVVMELKE
ncbi:ABC transporter ATP-binding protein [Paenibacillus yanchengensis]|uniref:ABC transporter ATP-binding protein n=1 Tax=Paenibacillus yanchengensis TaxID=2035833 RepID=A0ABW4YQW0_9BACL